MSRKRDTTTTPSAELSEEVVGLCAERQSLQQRQVLIKWEVVGLCAERASAD